MTIQQLIKKYQDQFKVCAGIADNARTPATKAMAEVQRILIEEIIDDLKKLENPLDEIQGLLQKSLERINQLKQKGIHV